MKRLSIVLLILLSAALAVADSPVKYSRIRVTVPDEHALREILSSGLDPEGVTGQPGGPMEFVANTRDLQALSLKGIDYKVVIQDLEQESKRGLVQRPYNALGFGYGSMGGYYTFAEVLAQLDLMRSLYPQFITARESVGASIEGRAIWAVKISDNPESEESGEPEVLYTGLHHAREPEGMMAVMYYMWWLLENHNSNAEAAYLVDHRQMWFIPVVNPDGYVYNQTNAPGGGGMWRKNRKQNPDGSYGIDLNRNYGPTEMWDSPLGGSDGAPFYSSDTYRGIAAFSEPETQAIQLFTAFHQFKTALNYHTFGNYLIFPWGAAGVETADSVAFREFASDMTGYNRYRCGLTSQTVRYLVRGTSDDYMYTPDGRPKIYAMTPEVGLTGFWPSTPEIFPLAQENLRPNMYIAYVAGQYTVTGDFSMTGESGEGGLTPGESFTLALTLRNKGTDPADDLTVSVSSEGGLLEWQSASASVAEIPAQSNSGSISLAGSVSSSLYHPVRTHVYVAITGADGFSHYDTIEVYLGNQELVFADSAGAGTSNWSTGTGWAQTGFSHSAPFSFTDSPSGKYGANANNTLAMLHPVDLATASLAQLSFWTCWAIEPLTDFGIVEVSGDSGATWSVVRTASSHSGSGGGTQAGVPWGYDAFTPGGTWIHQTADISAYAGGSVLVRFRMTSNNSDNRDGWYLDDIAVIAYVDSITSTTVSVPLDARWNIVSLPTSEQARPVGQTYPAAIGSLYGFSPSGGYSAAETLTSGKGYWGKFPAPTAQKISGPILRADTISLETGWNLIGSLSAPLDAGTLVTSPPGILESFPFGYVSGYVHAETLTPGKGYWIKASSAGSLYLTLPPAARAGKK